MSRVCWLNTGYAQMIFQISKIYCEAVWKDITSEHSDITLQLPKLFYHLGVFETCTTGNFIQIKLIFQFQPYTYSKRNYPFTQTI
jgi:hypothetical protein